MKCESIFKISEGRPNPSDYLKNGEITMMMITSSGDEPDLRDGKDLRRLALTLQVCPCVCRGVWYVWVQGKPDSG